MDTPALILAEDPHYCVATWDRTLIQLWRRETTERAVSNMCALARGFAAKHPGGLNGLFIVEADSEIPGAGARDAFARDTASKMVCCAVVPEGGGFRSATVRSVIVSLGVVMRQSFPYRFAADVDAAVNLLGPFLSVDSGGREALRRAIVDLRSRAAA